MIPASTWVTMLIDTLAQYGGSTRLSPYAEHAVAELVKEIQTDARAEALERLEALAVELRTEWRRA